jgi:hypothetical protein
MLAYWTERVSEFDSHKKTLRATLEMIKDKAKSQRAQRVGRMGLKAAAQDAFIRDFWEEEVEIDDEILTAKMIQDKLNEMSYDDSKVLANRDVCQVAVDICRSALSWDKMELNQIGG